MTEARGGLVVWLTGVPSAGKSTIARGVADAIAASERVQILDGDVIRAALWPDLGFSPRARAENVQRLAWLAAMLASHGVLPIVAAVSPYARDRQTARARCEESGHRMLEIHVMASPASVRRRDVKGLYRREVPELTGVTAPYEAPAAPELRVDTDALTVEESVRAVVELLRGARVDARNRGRCGR